MHLMCQLLGSAILMLGNIAIFCYICQRFLAAVRLRRKIMAEMAEFTSIVRQARDNLQYIGDQVTKGMKEIKEDVGDELRVTDRLTTQSTRLAAVLGRFATLEENVIELVRMDRNRENVMIETPVDVNEEIRKIVAAVESKKNESQEQHGVQPTDGIGPAATDVHRRSIRDSAHRTPLSKFSACGPREIAFAAKKTINDRARIPITPEVRLLGELDRPVSARDNSKRE